MSSSPSGGRTPFVARFRDAGHSRASGGLFGDLCSALVRQGRSILDAGCAHCRVWTHITSPAKYDPNRDYSSNPVDRATLDRYERKFNPASYAHDVCYGTFIQSRKKCDDRFSTSIRKVCSGLSNLGWPPLDKATCYDYARAWSQGVRLGGGSHRNPRVTGSQPGGVPW